MILRASSKTGVGLSLTLSLMKRMQRRTMNRKKRMTRMSQRMQSLKRSPKMTRNMTPRLLTLPMPPVTVRKKMKNLARIGQTSNGKPPKKTRKSELSTAARTLIASGRAATIDAPATTTRNGNMTSTTKVRAPTKIPVTRVLVLITRVPAIRVLQSIVSIKEPRQTT
ncbi:unnamed protein product [Leptidea sinapis]|uniref:Uncharacterized protein n=1 Tax=Leptidea sinapis TaxID=189913 RepID=A0A5E4PUQ9_9NEOP|nr:unnamed protein product [Leptidea sinapis]